MANNRFWKFATNTDVNSKLSVPVAALQYLPDFGEGHAVHIPVKDKTERVRNFRCSIRKQGHPKPVFDSGWRDYVRQNEVRIGDLIIFLAAGGQYRIEVWRLVNILGSLVWAAV